MLLDNLDNIFIIECMLLADTLNYYMFRKLKIFNKRQLKILDLKVNKYVHQYKSSVFEEWARACHLRSERCVASRLKRSIPTENNSV